MKTIPRSYQKYLLIYTWKKNFQTRMFTFGIDFNGHDLLDLSYRCGVL